MRNIRRLRNTIRRFTRPVRSRRGRAKAAGVILTYHRVVELNADPYSLAVSPSIFAAHLDYLRHTCRPMSLVHLVDCLRRGSLPHRSVALTFDDGYVDNLRYARPLLDSARVPATAFVSSGYTDGEREFWWDALEQLLLLPARVPQHLELSVDDQEHRWRLRSGKDRLRAHADVHSLLCPLGASERDAVLAHLARWASCDPGVRDDYRPMTAAELRKLTEGGLVDLGAHTVTHGALSAMHPDAQRREILTAREALESITGGPVLTHAHPFGDFNTETVGILKELGFVCACTGTPGRIEAGTDPFRLPRYTVRNWHGAAFGRCVEDFFHGESPV